MELEQPRTTVGSPASACVDWRQGCPDAVRFWTLIGWNWQGEADAEKVSQENDIYTVYQF